ncbi:MAG: hypothetical protein IPF67_20495 [Saprospiraceae bacterium]|nr:hypothetical protein [Candidatus Brachybacter algidus]
MPDKLTNLGFTDRFAQEATLNPDLHPARVIAQYKELYRVATAESEMLAEISEKMRHAAVDTPGMRELGFESANLARRLSTSMNWRNNANSRLQARK